MRWSGAVDVVLQNLTLDNIQLALVSGNGNFPHLVEVQTMG